MENPWEIWTHDANQRRLFRLDTYLVVLAGAGPGGLDRYALGTGSMASSGGRFSLGTFLIKISGSFFIRLLMTLLTERLYPHSNWQLFLVLAQSSGPGNKAS